MSEFVELGKVVKSLSKSVRSTTVANYVLAKAIKVIATLPTTEIVHCKDCKYWADAGRGYDPNTNSWSTVMVCDYNECSEGCGHTCWITDADDFCSRGERTE